MEAGRPVEGSLSVLFICSGKNRDTISPVVSAQGESIRKFGVDIEYFPVGGKGIGAYFKAVFRVKKHLRHRHYDIIHAHYGLSAIAACLVCRNIPLVVSFMGDDLLGSNRIDGKVKLLSGWFTRLNAFMAEKHYDFVIVKSEEMLTRLKKGTKAIVIPNGVDLDVFYPLRWSDMVRNVGFDKTAGNILFVGDTSRPEKNFSLATECVRRAGGNLYLHVVTGKDQSELCRYYNAADALLLTSYHEGSPNVVKEAMACNCPVVSTMVGDVGKLSEGVTGHFMTTFDEADIAAKLIAAVKFRSETGETDGRQRIIALKMDSKSVAERIISIYEGLLS